MTRNARMNFTLLWITTLAASLLWVAASAAIAGRIKRKWVRVMLFCLVNLVPFVLWGLFVALAAGVKFEERIDRSWFGYFVSLFCVFLVGGLMVLVCASRRKPGSVPAASTWPRMSLVLGCLAAMALGYITLCDMDFAFRTRCAILSLRLNSLYLASLPAIVSDSQD